MAHPAFFPYMLAFVAVLSGFFSSFVVALNTSSTVLIFARDAPSAASAYSGLRGYGIPYEVVEVPSTGVTLPLLNSSSTGGNYGAIVVLSEVAYSYTNGFYSALSTAQWQQLYDYQTAFGVRMVRLDVYPGADFGTTTAIPGTGCCDSGVEQLISITNATAFPTAGIKTGQGMTTRGLYHYPAVITNSSIAWEIAQFGAAGSFSSATTAAVINQFDRRQQMVWFSGWGTGWSATSSLLQHAWIHWATRGLYVGFRRIHFSTQIDDVFLPTALYQPSGTTFRLRPDDLANHATWTQSINSRMPAGSKYFIELAYNGNGNIGAAVKMGALDPSTNATCNRKAIVYTQEPSTTELEFQKPLGTGVNIWPTTPTSYNWSLACTQLDPLLQWLSTPTNLNAFAHISHTFTHESLNNATYADALKEISFNQAWMKQVGISQATQFSAGGLIPPAITGTHNGDVIKAWMDRGIKSIVGDNTRPVLMNTQNPFWPLTSTVEANGYAGLQIMPRWATTIFFNCDLPDCTTQEWIDTSAGSGDFNALLDNARSTNTRHLFGLRHDPFMFHQANMRQIDAPTTVINGVPAQLSLLQAWTETVIQEVVRLVNWPIITLKHDDLSADFAARMTRENCAPNLTYNFSANGRTITGVTVSAATGNSCAVRVPVTFPGPVKSNMGGTAEQVGSDPLTVWVKMNGSPVTYTLATPVPV